MSKKQAILDAQYGLNGHMSAVVQTVEKWERTIDWLKREKDKQGEYHREWRSESQGIRDAFVEVQKALQLLMALDTVAGNTQARDVQEWEQRFVTVSSLISAYDEETFGQHDDDDDDDGDGGGGGLSPLNLDLFTGGPEQKVFSRAETAPPADPLADLRQPAGSGRREQIIIPSSPSSPQHAKPVSSSTGPRFGFAASRSRAVSPEHKHPSVSNDAIRALEGALRVLTNQVRSMQSNLDLYTQTILMNTLSPIIIPASEDVSTRMSTRLQRYIESLPIEYHGIAKIAVSSLPASAHRDEMLRNLNTDDAGDAVSAPAPAPASSAAAAAVGVVVGSPEL